MKTTDGRTRKLLRRGLVVVGILVAGVLLAHLLWTWTEERRLERAKRLFEREIGELDLAGFALAPLPDEDNAAHWILEASDATRFPDETLDAGRDLLRRPVEAWDEADIALARTVIGENRRALELFARSLEPADSTFGIDYSPDLEPAIPRGLIDLVHGARLLRLEARLALLEQQPERATVAMRALQRIAEALSRESILIMVLAELGVLQTATHAARDPLTLGVGDETLLEQAASTLAAPDPRRSIQRCLRAEAALAAATPRGSHAEPGSEPPSWWRGLYVKPTVYRIRASIIDDCRELVGALDDPGSYLSLQGFEPGFWSRHSLLWDNLLESLAHLEATETARALGRAAVELWRNRLAGDPYPEELTGGVLPRDTYSGEPVEYERLEDGTARLAAPGAIERWKKLNAETSQREIPVFTWTLPEPTGAPIGR